MKIKIPTFKGVVPLADPRLLSPEVATEAVNCRFERGNLEPYKNWVADTTPIEANAQSLFRYADAFWFSWDLDVDVILSPTIDDDKNTVIWTGDLLYPRIGYNSNVTGNLTPPNVSYQLGVPAPSSPLVIEIVNNEQDDEDTENDETRFYVYTYVTENGEEGAPSAASNETTLLSTSATANITIPAMAANNSNVTQLRLYRTGTTLDSSDFFLVTTLPIATANYSDSAVKVQSITLNTIDFDMPPENLQGLTLLPNGIAVGFFDKTICFSESFLPYAMPIGYRQTTEHKIVGIGVTGNSVVVTTDGNPYIFSGVSPNNMSSIKLEEKQACVSKRSVVDMGDYVIYASPDGLVAASSQSTKLLTESLIRRDQWQEKYNPETIHAGQFEGKYMGFYSGTSGFIFDPRTQTFVDLDFYATAMFNDLKKDQLTLAVGGGLKVWDADVTNKTLRWKKRFELNGKILPSCAKVETDNRDSLSFKLWVDGVLKMDANPASETFWLPPLRGDYFEIEVSSDTAIRGIVLAEEMRALHYG